jgi:enamine deaminase RidA (YjgF/YER057c/UK114 family)
MDNLILVPEGMSLGLKYVASVRIFLTEFERDFYLMNDVYKFCFPEGKLPSRTCIGVTALAVGAPVEIDFVARR